MILGYEVSDNNCWSKSKKGVIYGSPRIVRKFIRSIKQAKRVSAARQGRVFQRV